MSRRSELWGASCVGGKRRRALFARVLLAALMLTAQAQVIRPSARGGEGAAREGAGTRDLQPGASLEEMLAGGGSHLYRFVLAPGECARLVVEQDGVDVALHVFGPDGRQLLEIDRPNGTRGPESVTVVARAGGEHRLKVHAWETWAPAGRYRVRFPAPQPAEPRDERRSAAEQVISEGEVHRTRGTAESSHKAVEVFSRAQALWQALGEDYEVAVALYGAGWAYNALSEHQRAVECFGRTLALMSAARDRYGEAIARAGRGWSLMSLGETERALDDFTRAQEIQQALGNARGEAVMRYGVGWAQALLARDQEALDSFGRSLALRRAVGDRRGEALTLASIGKIKNRLAGGPDGLQDLLLALAIQREVKDRRGQAETLSQIGWAYHARGEQEAALEHFLQALPLRQTGGDRAGEATALYGLARVERKRGNLSAARAHMEASLEIIESLRDAGASLQFRASYFASVQDYYEFYIELLMQQEGESAPLRHAEALHASERARARGLLDILSESNADIRRSVPPELLEEEKRLRRQLNAAADRRRHQSYRAAVKTDGAAREAEALQTAREVEELTARYREVEARIRDASPRYAALSRPQPLTLAEIQREVLDADTLLLEYALGERHSYLWAVTTDSLEAHTLPGRAVLEAEARRLYGFLTARNRRASGETAERRRARIAEADALYDEGALAFSRMLLGPVAARLPGKRLLVVAQGALELLPFGALPAPDPAITAEVARGGAQPLIVSHEIVTLSSASTLALLRRETAGRKPLTKSVAVLADPVFSGEDERVEAGVSRRSGHARAAVPGFVERSDAAGTEVSTGGFGQLPRLSGTRYEAEKILSFVPAGDGMMALDFAASRSVALGPELAQYRILHFATHSVIDNRHPELSGVVLSLVDRRGQRQDGVLRAHEVFTLRLPAELVVLSACGTGLGKEVRGEGLMSLTRGFMYAGAPRVVVSLWALSDRETAELMARFYRGMLGPRKLTAAAALRAAQVEMQADARWRSPYFWGAFVLQGEWR